MNRTDAGPGSIDEAAMQVVLLTDGDAPAAKPTLVVAIDALSRFVGWRVLHGPASGPPD